MYGHWFLVCWGIAVFDHETPGNLWGLFKGCGIHEELAEGFQGKFQFDFVIAHKVWNFVELPYA